MKKLSQILAITAIVLAPLVPNSTAFALGTCEIGYTGPNSDNLCVSETTYTCSVNNDTNIVIINDNEQTTISGDSLVEENTDGGTASTGSATNSNDVTFDVSIINNVDEVKICKVIATVPATPEVTPTVTPETPVTPVAPVENKPAVLPNTSSDATSGYIIAIAIVLGVGAAGSYLASMAIRRLQ